MRVVAGLLASLLVREYQAGSVPLSLLIAIKAGDFTTASRLRVWFAGGALRLGSPAASQTLDIRGELAETLPYPFASDWREVFD